MASEDPRVEFGAVGPVGVIRLVNPPLNPLTNGMRTRLREIAEAIAHRDDIRAVVFTSGSHRSLSVGSDIKCFPTTPEAGREVSASEHAAYDALENMPQPLVAVIRGHTLGGGLELSLVADIRVAEDTAVIGLPEVKVGVFASGGGTQRLPQIVGAGRARQMLLLGEPIDAATALSWGLVSALSPEGRGEAEAMRLAGQLANLPQVSMRATKYCVNVGLTQGRPAGREAEIDSIAQVYSSDDAQEGVRAFIEKRRPKFTHRPTTPEGPTG